MLLNDVIIKQKLSGPWHDKIKSCQFLFALSWKEWGWGGRKWPQRVIKIMKIASPCQADVHDGLKLLAIKVKLPEKLLPGYVWNKGNLELPRLTTNPWETEKTARTGWPVTRHTGKTGGGGF